MDSVLLSSDQSEVHVQNDQSSDVTEQILRGCLQCKGLVFQRLLWAYSWHPLQGLNHKRLLEATGLCFLFMLLVGPIAYYCGYLDLKQISFDPLLVIKVFFVPSLIEETVFRVLLNPHRQEDVTLAVRSLWASLSISVYVLWHPLNAWLLTPSARHVFYQLPFLGITLVLGFLCLLVYVKSGSVWTAVIVHWIVVSVWLTFGGLAVLLPTIESL